MLTRTTLATLAVSALTLPMAFVAPASASHGGNGDVRTSGSCSGRADWKLKAKPDNGRLDIEFEVDSNRVGQAWRVRLTDNGTQIFAGTRTTLAPSGSFAVHILRANLAGPDTIRARAVNTVNGAVCAGRITL